MHFQSGGVSGPGKEEFKSLINTEAGRPGHVPDTEQRSIRYT